MGIEALGKDAFLNLLTTQLKFQDPLKPMESTAFVAQLAQFRELESSIEMNKTLTTLVQGTASMNNMGAANLLGRNVEVPAGKLSHIFGKSEKISYQLDTDANEVFINVVNLAGNVIKTLAINTVQGKGANEVLWDGKDNQGNMVQTGTYAYAGAAKNGDGSLTPIKLSSVGEVSGVSYGEGGPFVTVNGFSVPVKEITRVIK
jgi:flagellar basal-body rod modification protein FlgD